MFLSVCIFSQRLIAWRQQALVLPTFMDLIDILWNVSQDRTLLEMNSAQEIAHRRHTSSLQRLTEENQALRVRVGVLIRMLIERGVFSAADYDTAVKSMQAQLEAASAQRAPARRSAVAARPSASRKK